MTNDIQKAVSANPVKNGTMLVGTSWTGNYSTRDTYVQNIPSMNDIEAKYDNRLDDIVYYSIAIRGTPASGCC